MTRPLRVATLALGVALLLALAVRKLRGGPVPAFQGSADADAGASPPIDDSNAGVTGWPELDTDRSEPTEPTELASVMPLEPTPAPVTLEPATVPAAATPDGERIWVAPMADGACPLDHPVKAKTASGIYHLPGGVSYARTRPDRCYRSAADAAADGLRSAKR